MAIVSDSLGFIGDDVDLTVFYDDALATDDPEGPPGNKWVIDACAVDHFQISVRRVNEVEVEIEAQGSSWRQNIFGPTGNPNVQTFNWNATGNLATWADVTRLKMRVSY